MALSLLSQIPEKSSVINTGVITTLNNAQSKDANGDYFPLTVQGNLPTNYNIIINSSSDYGKVMFSNPSGSTTFGINTSLSAINISGNYEDVVGGLYASLSSLASTSGNNGSLYWSLHDDDNNSWWDLNISYVGNQTINTDISNSANNAYGYWIKENDGSSINISSNITTSGTNAHGIYSESSDTNTFTVNGNITTNGAGAYAINNDANSADNTFTLGGVVSGGILNAGTNTVITNTGSIDAITNSGTLTTLTNSGTLTTLTNTGTLTTLTNTGTLNALDNSGTLTTFNNDGAVSYSGTLPINYNLIINSSSDYGQTTFSTVSGAMAFGIDITNSSGSSLNGYFADIFSGINTTDDLASLTGNNGNYYWGITNRSGG